MPTFIAKLHHILERYPEYIKWNRQGDAFTIVDETGLLENVCKEYFNHSKLSSFFRQLQLYGFQRNVVGNYRDESTAEIIKTEFRHPDFKRGCKKDSLKIKRQRRSRRKIYESNYDHTENSQQEENISNYNNPIYYPQDMSEENERNRISNLPDCIYESTIIGTNNFDQASSFGVNTRSHSPTLSEFSLDTITTSSLDTSQLGNQSEEPYSEYSNIPSPDVNESLHKNLPEISKFFLTNTSNAQYLPSVQENMMIPTEPNILTSLDPLTHSMTAYQNIFSGEQLERTSTETYDPSIQTTLQEFCFEPDIFPVQHTHPDLEKYYPDSDLFDPFWDYKTSNTTFL